MILCGLFLINIMGPGKSPHRLRHSLAEWIEADIPLEKLTNEKRYIYKQKGSGLEIVCDFVMQSVLFGFRRVTSQLRLTFI